MDPQRDYRDYVRKADAMAAAAKAEAEEANVLALQGKVMWIADLDIVHEAVLALNLAPRPVDFVVVPAVYGDRVYIHQRDEITMTGVSVLPAVSWMTTGYVPKAGGKVRITYTIPALSVGQKLTIPLRLVGYRPAALAT